MSVIYRDKEIGCIQLNRGEDSYRLVIRGGVGSQAIVDSLRRVNQLGINDAQESPPEEVIKRLKRVWGRIDKYLTEGGIVSQQGNGVFFRIFNESRQPNSLRQGFANMTTAQYCREQGLASLAPFSSGEILYIAAPGMGLRLKNVKYRPDRVSRANPTLHITFPGEPVGFMRGVNLGFSRMLTRSFEKPPEVPQILAAEQPVVQRLYDHVRKQVPVLEQM